MSRTIEAGEPHVANDHELERVLRVLEPRRQPLACGLRPDVRAEGLRVGRGAGDDDLDGARLVVITVPSGPQLDDPVVEIGRDPSAHAHHEGLARQPVGAALVVCDEILRHLAQPLVGADERLDRAPLTLQGLLARVLFALGELLELGVDLGPLALGEVEPSKAVLVVDGDGRLVLYGLQDVVHADVVAEDLDGALVVQLDRRPGEADEGSPGERIAEVLREPVGLLTGLPVELRLEAVLASVRLVGDDDDVAAVREQLCFLGVHRGELLDRREVDASRSRAQQVAQVCAALGLDRALAQQALGHREGAEELVVEIVAVGEHDDRRVLHARVEDQLPRVEDHRQALAGALGVPDDTDASIATLARGARRLFDRAPDRVELMVGGHLLLHLRAGRPALVLESDEALDEVEEARLVEDAAHQHLERLGVLGRIVLSLDGAPEGVARCVRGDRADASLDVVRGDQDHVRDEQ